ncbi:hypothetical protein DN536_34950, partial [Burkholderia multivorans]
VATIGYFVDDRTLVGVPIWHKAAKFGVSITIYTLTIAWMLTFLPSRSRFARVIGTIIAFGITVELVLIVLQIIRGQMSHFNVGTVFDAAVYYGMGGFIVAVWIANPILGIVLAVRRRARPRHRRRAPPGTRGRHSRPGARAADSVRL